MRRVPCIVWKESLFHFCEAPPTLLHLQKVGRSLHKLITIEDIARGLAMQWEVEEFDDHPKGVTIMLRRDWDPEFSTEASVLQAAIKNVAEGSHIRYDLQHGRTLLRSRGWLAKTSTLRVPLPSHCLKRVQSTTRTAAGAHIIASSRISSRKLQSRGR